MQGAAADEQLMRQVALLPAGVQIWHKPVLACSPLGAFPAEAPGQAGALGVEPSGVTVSDEELD